MGKGIMMNDEDAKRYDYFIFDGARDLAADHGQDVHGLRNALLCKGVIDFNALDIVTNCQSHKDYFPENYRGRMCDVDVIEAIKDCLRPIYGFD